MEMTDSPDRTIITVAVVRNEGLGSGYTMKLDEIDLFLEDLKVSEIGDRWSVEIKSMDKQDFNNLPEFEGF